MLFRVFGGRVRDRTPGDVVVTVAREGAAELVEDVPL